MVKEILLIGLMVWPYNQIILVGLHLHYLIQEHTRTRAHAHLRTRMPTHTHTHRMKMKYMKTGTKVNR